MSDSEVVLIYLSVWALTLLPLALGLYLFREMRDWWSRRNCPMPTIADEVWVQRWPNPPFYVCVSTGSAEHLLVVTKVEDGVMTVERPKL